MNILYVSMCVTSEWNNGERKQNETEALYYCHISPVVFTLSGRQELLKQYSNEIYLFYHNCSSSHQHVPLTFACMLLVSNTVKSYSLVLVFLRILVHTPLLVRSWTALVRKDVRLQRLSFTRCHDDSPFLWLYTFHCWIELFHKSITQLLSMIANAPLQSVYSQLYLRSSCKLWIFNS